VVDALHHLDGVRRLQGRLLDAAGLGPVETPWTTVARWRGVRLREYAGRPSVHASVLLVPAPIKRPYIWDLAPPVSAIRRLLDLGLSVYLADWTLPGAADGDLGLQEYADDMVSHCVQAIGRRTGRPGVMLAGRRRLGAPTPLGAMEGRIAEALDRPSHYKPGGDSNHHSRRAASGGYRLLVRSVPQADTCVAADKRRYTVGPRLSTTPSRRSFRGPADGRSHVPRASTLSGPHPFRPKGAAVSIVSPPQRTNGPARGGAAGQGRDEYARAAAAATGWDLVPGHVRHLHPRCCCTTRCSTTPTTSWARAT
jgi:hypothetical protein